MKARVYEHLFIINAAFDQILESLHALQVDRHFHPTELARFRRLSRENRASLNSYLAAVIESVETADAGRHFQKRLAQERSDEAAR